MEAARPAGANDLDRLLALYAAAADELRSQKGGDVWWRHDRRPDPETSLADALADPDQLVLAGTIDSAVVGMAVVGTEVLHDGRLLGVVTDIYVEPDARSVGVGEALITEAVAWCRAKGCVGVDGLALPGARATKNFFETFGFTARAIVVHHRLDDEQGSGG